MTYLLLLVFLAVYFSTSHATYGVDISTYVDAGTFGCMVQNGYTFAIPRVYMSVGRVDPNGAANVINAWNGGMAHVDGYIFPCYSCGNPEGQMDDAINNLLSSGIKFAPKNSTFVYGADHHVQESLSVGMLWIDIEGSDYWSSDWNSNIDFLTRMASHGEARGISLGVYTSKYQWETIAGYSDALSRFPLWYAHYDYDPSWNDFQAFGGWSWPAIKQFEGDTYLCGASVDLSSY